MGAYFSRIKTWSQLMLFNKTLQNLEGADAKDVTNIEKYLHKTVGMDLVNMIFALSSDSQEKNLTQVKWSASSRKSFSLDSAWGSM